MTTKLTLSINEKTVQRAKIISKKRGKSISKMVEEFLNGIGEKEGPEASSMKQIKKIMEPYRHKLMLPKGMDYKKMISEWRYEDYMKESEKRMKAATKPKKK